MKLFLAKTWQRLAFPKQVQIAIMRVIQDEFLIGVTGVILNKDNEILVCNHTYRDGERWSLPGGYIKKKEHPREGLAREIEEEMGFSVGVDEEYRIRTDRETARLDISLIGHYICGEFRSSNEVSEAGFFSFANLPLLQKEQHILIQEILNKKGVTKNSSSFSFLKKLGNIFK